MKKWEYKVACYSYDDGRMCWVSVFDSKEAQTIEELIGPLGVEGWELINVTSELAIPAFSGFSPMISPAVGQSRGGILNRLRSMSGDNAAPEAVLAPPPPPGGFDVKTYRAFFKRPKR